MAVKKVQKSNDLNHANFSDFSLSVYRVLLNLIAQIQRYSNEGTLLQLPLVSRQCTLSAHAFSEEFPSVGSQSYSILKEAVDKLMKTTYSVRKDKGLLKINVCSQAYYVEKEGRIDIRFTEEIMPHLAELGNNFTMYNLKEISGFGSMYTTRLYELLMQFKVTGIYDTSVSNLRYLFGCLDTLKRYNDFKRFAIEQAVNEINSQYEIDLKYDEVRKGRKIDRIIFTFKRTQVNKSYDPVRKKIRTQLLRPRRKKSVKEEMVEVPSVHPNQQQMDLE